MSWIKSLKIYFKLWVTELNTSVSEVSDLCPRRFSISTLAFKNESCRELWRASSSSIYKVSPYFSEQYMEAFSIWISRSLSNIEMLSTEIQFLIIRDIINHEENHSRLMCGCMDPGYEQLLNCSITAWLLVKHVSCAIYIIIVRPLSLKDTRFYPTPWRPDNPNNMK